MTNTVTMTLTDYDTIKDEIRNLKNEIKDMERDRLDELKNIIRIIPTFIGADVYVNATDVVREIYGEDLRIAGANYKLKAKDVETIIYSVYTEVEEED